MNKSARAMFMVLTLVLLSTSAVAENSAWADTNGLHYYFATASDTYDFGDVIPIDYVVTNVSGDSMAVFHPCGSPPGSFGYQIWAPGPPADPDPRVICGCCGCIDEIYGEWFGAGESYIRHFDRSTLSFPRPGTYTLDGWFNAWTEDYVSLRYDFSLDFELIGGPTGTAEFEGAWGTIKALYR